MIVTQKKKAKNQKLGISPLKQMCQTIIRHAVYQLKVAASMNRASKNGAHTSNTMREKEAQLSYFHIVHLFVTKEYNNNNNNYNDLVKSHKVVTKE